MHLRHLMIASALLVASAVPGSVSAQDSFSQDTDRPGGDYRSFDINGDAEACRETCDRERQCRAWSFVKAPTTWHGLQRPPARCWLKTMVPAPRANPCCASGIAGGQIID